MGRYTTTATILDSNSNSRFSTTIITKIPVLSSDIYIQTTSIERLDKLANTFYGDSTLWWIIASANFLGKGTVVIPQNTTLRIPSKDTIKTIIDNTNLR